MQYSSEIFIKVKNPKDWQKFSNTKLEEGFYENFFEEAMDEDEDTLYTFETSFDEDELIEIADFIKENFGKDAIFMAKTTNINIDPYYALVSYCGTEVHFCEIADMSEYEEYEEYEEYDDYEESDDDYEEDRDDIPKSPYDIADYTDCSEVLTLLNLMENSVYKPNKKSFEEDRKNLKKFELV